MYEVFTSFCYQIMFHYIDTPHFMNSPGSGHVGFLLLAVIDYAAMNNYAQVLGGKPLSYFQSGCVILPSYQKV